MNVSLRDILRRPLLSLKLSQSHFNLNRSRIDINDVLEFLQLAILQSIYQHKAIKMQFKAEIG